MTIYRVWQNEILVAGADPGFLKRGFICLKMRGVRFADFILFFKYLMEMNLFGLTETKLFHFHRIFKNGGRGGGFN